MSSPNTPVSNQVETAPSKEEKAPPGRKSYFEGTRKAYLHSQVFEYGQLKKGSRQNFWHRLYSTWWLRYPWKLDDKEEPPKDNPAEMTRLASVAPGEQGLKSAVESRLKKRLSEWFTNHGTAKAASRQAAIDWLPLLQRVHQLQNPRPRQRTTVQQFMLDYSGTVNAGFVSQHADGKGMGGTQKMNARYEIAKRMFTDEYFHLKSALDKKAAIQFQADTEEWSLLLTDIPLAEDVSRVRDTLFEAVHPLLEAIGSYAGCHVSLIAGNPVKDNADKGFFTAVHWWPGDRTKTDNWTQWNEDAFSTGVAGPFLAYAGENVQLLQGAKDGTSPPVVGVQQAPLPPNHPNPIPIAHRTKYRPLPTKKAVLNPKKRKHTTKSPSTRYFDDAGSENDDPGSRSGDGSSSGDSMPSNAPPHVKRQRIVGIATRSSTQNCANGSLDPASPIPPATPQLSPAILSRSDLVDNVLVDPVTAFIASPGLQPAGVSAGNADVGPPSSDDVPSVNGGLPADSGIIPLIKVGNAFDKDAPPAVNPEIAPAIDADVAAVGNVGVTAGTTTNAVVIASSTESASAATNPPPPPTSSNDIDTDSVPDFLLHHGKGKREVNIFSYLDKVQDPRFRQILLHYIRFEANDNSGVGGSLSTTNRPAEISQWTTRARPAIIPDYKKGGRTFSDFVDSVFVWWGSLQPPWRSFERGKVSREVQGGWEVLHAARINGLLNIVVLVYWWGRILEEEKPKDGIRADYEEFADDVAWVLSNLSI